MSELGDNIRKANQRILANFDQGLQEFKYSYENAWSEDEKKKVHSWLEQLVQLQKQTPAWPGVTLKVTVSHDLTDEQGECHYSGSAELNPRILLKAVEAWERGEEFVPPSAFGTI